jgi:hypothetical protein
LDCADNPLTDLRLAWARPPQEGYFATPYDVSSATLHVPAGSKALYQADDTWKRFGTILEDGGTGAQAILPTFEVYASAGTVYINSPVSEQIDVYSIGGALLYRSTKPAGATTISATLFPQGIVIVKGSSGWTKKLRNSP